MITINDIHRSSTVQGTVHVHVAANRLFTWRVTSWTSLQLILSAR